MIILDHVHPKIIESTFSFPELVPAWKNHFILSIHFWDKVNFRVPWPDWPHPFLTNAHSKNFRSAFNFCDHVSTCKKSVYSICSFFRNSQLRSPVTRLATHILTIFTSKIFNHLLICVKLYQHAKNQLLSSVLSSDKISFRVQSADWSHPFLTMPKQKFSD